MEEKGRPLLLIFLVALIFGAVLGALRAYSAYLPILLHEHDAPFAVIGFWFSITELTRLAISPFLIFIAFYLVGRKINLKANLSRSILSLIVGGFVGNFLGFSSVTLIFNPDRPKLLIGAVFTGLNPHGSFLRIFFVAFTALAIAYLRPAKSEDEVERKTEEKKRDIKFIDFF